MRISVALCTYNGSRFLEEQLESLAHQSLVPYELVVCDDGSTDDSLEKVHAFAGRARFRVTVFGSTERLGPAANFDRAIRSCGGDLIALCDQDDVWDSAKLETAGRMLEADPALGAVFSDAEVVDEELRSLGHTMWEHGGFVAAERRAVEQGAALAVLLKHYVVTGAALAFRADLRPALLPIPPGWYHDAWIAIVAAAVSRVVAIPRALMRYRQHGANVIGGRFEGYLPQTAAGLRLGRDAYYRQEVVRFEQLYDRLLQLRPDMVRPGALELVRAKLDHLQRRAGLPRNRLLRIPGVLQLLAGRGYARFAKDWRSVAMDLFFP